MTWTVYPLLCGALVLSGCHTAAPAGVSEQRQMEALGFRKKSSQPGAALTALGVAGGVLGGGIFLVPLKKIERK